MANVSRRTLSELSFNSTDFVVSGLILSKTDPNIFQQKDSNEYRSVFLLTIRDSKRCITNCKCWGSKDWIENYHRKFNIYDVIDIVCPRIVPIRETQQEREYQPIVTMPFQLVLNEGIGFLEQHIGVIGDLPMLCRSSIRPLSGVLNLADISSTNINFRGHYVDLLVTIAMMKPVKDVKAKSGYPLKCLEVVVIDQSLPNGMMLTIWNTGWIGRSQQHWKASKTVLHLIDARVGYSEFYRTTTLGLCSRSLVFENPLGKEAEKVAEYAATASSIDLDFFSRDSRDFLPDPKSITTLMTVKQIYDRISGAVKDDKDEFTAVLLAIVTKLELDGPMPVIARKCKSCNHRIQRDRELCDNEQCQMSFSFNYSGDKFERFFDINIHFSDHTGTLIEARLSGAVAEQIFELTPDEFTSSNDTQKDQLKWKFLLERFEVKIFIKRTTAVRPIQVVQVVDMKPLDLKEFSEKIIVY